MSLQSAPLAMRGPRVYSMGSLGDMSTADVLNRIETATTFVKTGKLPAKPFPTAVVVVGVALVALGFAFRRKPKKNPYNGCR